MIAAIILAGLAAVYPMSAAGSDDPLAACMWENAATSTAAFVDNANGARDFTLFMKAAAPCADALPKAINLSSLRKRLAKARPTTIKADLAPSDDAFVCPRGAGGEPANCKPAGE